MTNAEVLCRFMYSSGVDLYQFIAQFSFCEWMALSAMAIYYLCLSVGCFALFFGYYQVR